MSSESQKRKAPGREVSEKRQQAKENQESVPRATGLEEALKDILEAEGEWPQTDNRNVREDGSQRQCYACGINGASKNAVWDLNKDSAKTQGKTGLKLRGRGVCGQLDRKGSKREKKY